MATPAVEPADFVTSQGCVRGWYGAALLLVAVIVAAPVWLVEHPPLVDYPNHLARGYILTHFSEGAFRFYLEIDNRPIPNLAIDFFLIAAKPFCTVRTGGKLFLTATLWLVLLGWHLLGRAIHGKPTWLALGGALACYHSMFLYGFLNYSFAMGWFLVSLAAWVSWRDNLRWWHFPLLFLLALGCFFSHLSALIFLAGSALVITICDFVLLRDYFSPGMQREGEAPAEPGVSPGSGSAGASPSRSTTQLLSLIPVLLPFGISFLGGGSGPAAPVWNWQAKLVGALCLFRGYNRHLDAVYIAAVAGFLILLGIWCSRVTAKNGPLFTGLGCVAMFLIGPYEIFSGIPADARFLPAAAALVALSLDLTIPLKKALVLLGLFFALVLFRCGMIAGYWQSFQPELREQVSLMQSFPWYAKVYPMVNLPEAPEDQKLGTASFHMIHYAVIDRHIYSPHNLAFDGQQPIRYKQPPIAFHTSVEPGPSIVEVWTKVSPHYDFLWCWNLPELDRRFLERQCELVAESGNSSIWRVKRN